MLPLLHSTHLLRTHPFMLADAAAATLFTVAPHPLVLADTAAATLFAVAPLPLMLTDAAASTVLTPAPTLLMLAEAAAATLFAFVPLPLMLADAAAATFYVVAPHSLVFADAAASTVLTPVPTSLVLTQVRGLAGLLGTCRMQLRSLSLARATSCSLSWRLSPDPSTSLRSSGPLFLLQAAESVPSLWPSISSDCLLHPCSKPCAVFFAERGFMVAREALDAKCLFTATVD